MLYQTAWCLSGESNFILSVYLVNENRSYLHDIKRQEGGLSMNLKMKKVIAWVLVCLCVYGSMPKEMVKAASAGSIYYVPKGQQGCYTDSLDVALQCCSMCGGVITLERDIYYDLLTSGKF